MIVDLQNTAEEMRQAELRRAQARLQSLTPEQQAAVEALTRGLMNKFLPYANAGDQGRGAQADTVMLEVMRAVFNLPAVQEQSKVMLLHSLLPQMRKSLFLLATRGPLVIGSARAARRLALAGEPYC